MHFQIIKSVLKNGSEKLIPILTALMKDNKLYILFIKTLFRKPV